MGQDFTQTPEKELSILNLGGHVQITSQDGTVRYPKIILCRSCKKNILEETSKCPFCGQTYTAVQVPRYPKTVPQYEPAAVAVTIVQEEPARSAVTMEPGIPAQKAESVQQPESIWEQNPDYKDPPLEREKTHHTLPNFHISLPKFRKGSLSRKVAALVGVLAVLCGIVNISDTETTAPIKAETYRDGSTFTQSEELSTVDPMPAPIPEVAPESALESESPSIIVNAQTSVTMGQKNALAAAQSYIKHSSFSYSDLIEQLEYSGYTHEEAVYGADNCGADWMQEALDNAKSYIQHSDFSYSDLIEQLEYSGYTHEEAVYGADNCGADWMQEALDNAKSYISHSAFSYSGLVEQLEYSGYTHEEAVYGADSCGADWMAEATEAASSYIKHSSFSRQELIEQLEYEGFTNEQALYGVQAVGY